ncbi:MAG: hypothetical protein V4686_02335 [Patescibacteria group bacterium]
MKNTQNGSAVVIALLIVLLLSAAGGGYVYMENKKLQPSYEAQQSVNQSAEKKTVVANDFNSCMSQAKDASFSFTISFMHGSDFSQVQEFAKDFKTKFSRAELEIESEQQYVASALARYQGELQTVQDMGEYKKNLTENARAKIDINVPAKDLGTLTAYNNFVEATLAKYPNAKFEQYSGSVPNNFLEKGYIDKYISMMEQSCDYRFNKMTAKEKDEEEMVKLEIALRSSEISVREYYQNNGFYGKGGLSRNNGFCSDTGTHGLKTFLEDMKKFTGDLYCYASETEYAISVPIKLGSQIGYCVDSTGFNGTTSSPQAASKGYCVAKQVANQNISKCQNADGNTPRDRWICVGNLIDPFPSKIYTIVSPFATPVSQKVSFCKKFSGVEKDYCLSSITFSQNTGDGGPTEKEICAMVSNTNKWFKDDCGKDPY